MKPVLDTQRILGQRPPLHGFTLVELLVVVTIITLLAAMLLPALEAAMVAGQRARCLSNMHTQYTGLMQYAIDNRGWFAPGVTSADSPDYHQISSQQPAPGHRPDNRVVKMRPYLPNGDIMICPILAHLGPTWADRRTEAGGFGGWEAAGDVHISTPYMLLAGFATAGASLEMVNGEPEPPLNVQDNTPRTTVVTHRIDYFYWRHTGQVLLHDWGHFGAGTGLLLTPYDTFKTPEMPVAMGDGSAFVRGRDDMRPRMVIASPAPYPNPSNPGFPGTYIW